MFFHNIFSCLFVVNKNNNFQVLSLMDHIILLGDWDLKLKSCQWYSEMFFYVLAYMQVHKYVDGLDKLIHNSLVKQFVAINFDG